MGEIEFPLTSGELNRAEQWGQHHCNSPSERRWGHPVFCGFEVTLSIGVRSPAGASPYTQIASAVSVYAS
jgi:hypothetical protein